MKNNLILEVGISSMLPNLEHTPNACFSIKYCSFFIFNTFHQTKNLVVLFISYLI